jgi:hypothetical protein
LYRPVETTDPAALAAYANELRPIVANLRTLAEDATSNKRIHSREFLRSEMLKNIRVLEARIDAAAPPEPDEPDGCGGSPTN